MIDVNEKCQGILKIKEYHHDGCQCQEKGLFDISWSMPMTMLGHLENQEISSWSMSIPGQGVQEAFLTWWLRSQRLPPLLASLWPLPRQIGTFIIIILIIIILIIIIFQPRPTGTYIIQLVSIPHHLLQLGPPPSPSPETPKAITETTRENIH